MNGVFYGSAPALYNEDYVDFDFARIDRPRSPELHLNTEWTEYLLRHSCKISGCNLR
jgi:hypothetical protein